ncbi:MAG TPA: hypothetical protein VJN93_01070 [Candidatus Acidoferrum sp.]|nr:hypothetical protein [Candidatus Acidoferrum sp.]
MAPPMDLRKFFLGRGEFKSPSEIIQTVRESPDFDSQRENLANAEPLLLFQTSKQQTWLVATAARLYCVLDDLRRSFPPVRWSINKDNLVAAGQVTVNISARDSNDRTGLLNIGPRSNWLYSKKLFTAKSIEDEVKGLISRRMLS